MNELFMSGTNKKNFLEYYLNFKGNKNKELGESKKLNDIFESHENLSEKKVIGLKLHYLVNSVGKSYLSGFEYSCDYVSSIDLLTFEDGIYKDLSGNEIDKESYNLIVKDIKVDFSKTKIFIFDEDILYINLLK